MNPLAYSPIPTDHTYRPAAANMGWLAATLCNFGFHKYGAWFRIKASDPTADYFQRFCRRCGNGEIDPKEWSGR